MGPALTWPSLRSRRPTWPAASGRALIYQLRATGPANDSPGRRGPSRLPRRGVPAATCRQREGGAGPAPVPAPVRPSASRAWPGSALRCRCCRAKRSAPTARCHLCLAGVRSSPRFRCWAALRAGTRLQQNSRKGKLNSNSLRQDTRGGETLTINVSRSTNYAVVDRSHLWLGSSLPSKRGRPPRVLSRCGIHWTSGSARCPPPTDTLDL